ncbi:MAG: lytic transglycosylase domain-containing protein [Pseudomonadota bacterium]
MKTESPINPPPGDLVRWGFIMILIFSMVLFPRYRFREELSPVLKGPRPFTIERHQEDERLSVTNTNENRFHSIIISAANAHRVDPALIKAVIMAESNYNPYAISKKGAVGLMQLMPSTATDLGIEDLYNPEHNIHGGVKYLKQLLKRFEGDLRMTIAAYNAGTSKIQQYQGIPPFKATRNYVKKVISYYEFYKGQNKKQKIISN